jgi:alpha-tubulin suppressor-like RCC1 family protein
MRVTRPPVHLLTALLACALGALPACAPPLAGPRAVVEPIAPPPPPPPPAPPAPERSAAPAAPVAPAAVEAPAPDHRWAEVAAGADHTCARTFAGEVYCWGGNDRGQLGDGTQIDRKKPVRVKLDGAAAELALSNYASCARLVSGNVACWGDSTGWDDKEAGKAVYVLTPTPAVRIAGATRLFVGELINACVNRADGTVACWGLDTEPHFPKTMTPREAPSLQGAKQIGRAMDFGCALWEIPGELRCWGRETLYRVFGDARTKEHKEPAPIPGLPKVRAFHVDYARTCAVGEDDEVYCWGDRLEIYSGGLALQWITPARVAGLTGAVEVHHDLYVLCARMRDGAVLCLGKNGQGQLGDGTRKPRLKAQRVLGVEDAVGLSVHADHGCAVSRGGKLWCWGGNPKGEIGDGTTEDRATPVEIPAPAE